MEGHEECFIDKPRNILVTSTDQNTVMWTHLSAMVERGLQQENSPAIHAGRRRDSDFGGL